MSKQQIAGSNKFAQVQENGENDAADKCQVPSTLEPEETSGQQLFSYSPILNTICDFWSAQTGEISSSTSPSSKYLEELQVAGSYLESDSYHNLVQPQQPTQQESPQGLEERQVPRAPQPRQHRRPRQRRPIAPLRYAAKMDQNNPKFFNKFITWQAEPYEIAQMKAYEKAFSNRYYFFIGLAFKMKNQKINVQKYMVFVKMKKDKILTTIEKLKRQINKINNYLQLNLENHDGSIIDKLKVQLHNLTETVKHKKHVIVELQEISVRAFKLFLNGKYEQALFTLYLKNDRVIKKRNYFNQAWKIVYPLLKQLMLI